MIPTSFFFFFTHYKLHKDINQRVYKLCFIVKAKMKLHNQTKDKSSFHGRNLVHFTARLVVKRKRKEIEALFQGGAEAKMEIKKKVGLIDRL